VRSLFVAAGLIFMGRIEVILVAPVDRLPTIDHPAIAGISVLRSVGECGTRFTATLDGDPVGVIGVEADMTDGGTRFRLAGWADIGYLCVRAALRRKSLGTCLMATAADWLRLGRVDHLIDYAWPEQTDRLAFLQRLGFEELTRTERGWQRTTA
jgi:GNAT superfamily N-acetyltransferase